MVTTGAPDIIEVTDISPEAGERENIKLLQITPTSIQVQFPDITGGNLMYIEAEKLAAGEQARRTLAAKTTATAFSLVAVKKLAKDASIVLSASAKYADLSAKPTMGCSITLG